jgi:hypothetical protein
MKGSIIDIVFIVNNLIHYAFISLNQNVAMTNIENQTGYGSCVMG